MVRVFTLLILLLALPAGLNAGDRISAEEQFYNDISVNEDSMFKNWGVGALSCADYIAAREFPDSPIGPYDATFRQWLMGFTTAFNIKDRGTSDLLGRTSVEKAMKWIEGYCRKNQGKEYFAAVWELTKIAYPYREKPITNMAENHLEK